MVGATAAVRRRRWRLFVPLLAGVLLLVGGGAAAGYYWTLDGRIRAGLQSDDVKQARRAVGAIVVLDRVGFCEALVARMHASDDWRIREACVYGLGKIAGRDKPVGTQPVDGSRWSTEIVTLLEDEANGYVRQAAWLTLARIDPQTFRDEAVGVETAQLPWDDLGIGQGWLQIKDRRGLERLFHWAIHGNDDQRQVACRAFEKALRPYLETAGRWPADYNPKQGDIWPAALVNELQRRTAGLDLVTIADNSIPYLENAAKVQRNVRRITGSREKIVDFLYGR